MTSKEKFVEEIRQSFTFKGEYLTLGGAIFQQQPVKDLQINIPLKTLNRHGLIAGATGTGKTKTLQVITERLSEKSVPVLLMDIKGDLSGLAASGTVNAKIEERHKNIGEPYAPRAFPVELLTISEQKGVRLRATVSEFGPVLFSKILELNDTQSGIVSLIFKYCDDNQLPLLDLKDFKKVLQFITNEGKDGIESEYGKISTASTGTILRKIIELEQQQANLFFGEKSFEVDDLMRINEEGFGMISILRLNDLQDKPKLFSTFMLSLLAEIYSSFPEEGDLDQPKLAIFIDEDPFLIITIESKKLSQTYKNYFQLLWKIAKK